VKVKILKENFDEYFGLGNEVFKRKKYNSATILFFKAIVSGIDIFIFKKEGFVPSSDVQRSRILEEKCPELFDIFDKDFLFYQGGVKVDKEAAEVLKEDAKRIRKLFEGL